MEEIVKMYGDDKDCRDDFEELSLFEIALKWFPLIKQPVGRSFWTEMTLDAAKDHYLEFKESYLKLPLAKRKDMDLLMHFDLGWLYANSPKWILRNLTTKEFVRQSVVARGTNNGPFGRDQVGLGEALLSRICWSSVPNATQGWDGIHRGIWAGHRFDIILMDAIEGKTGWKDVSESVYEELVVLWKNEYGQNWETWWHGERFCGRSPNDIFESRQVPVGEPSSPETSSRVLLLTTASCSFTSTPSMTVPRRSTHSPLGFAGF
jgi:hypothetical protein